jgi:L-lactate dehydrogenase
MKVGIVGAGFVGSTGGYALIMQGVGSEIVLVDRNPARAEAEADDLRHAVPFSHPIEVRAGTYRDLKGCRVVLMCAGVGQRSGETRLHLLQRNAAVFRDVIPSILKHAPDCVLVVATNPVDVMTHLTAEIAAEHGIESRRVVGSGTTLDTARFRSLLATECGIAPHHVHGYVVGEHGDSEVLCWSSVFVAGMTLKSFAEFRQIAEPHQYRAEIDRKVRGAAYSIIEGKGATYYGVGAALARITRAVLLDQRLVLTVCTPAADVVGVKNVTVSLPRLVGAGGVLETFPLPLGDEERTELQRSASIVREAIDELAASPS